MSAIDVHAQSTLQKSRHFAVSEIDSMVQLDRWILPETFEVYADTSILDGQSWTLNPVSGDWSWDVEPGRRLQTDSLHFYYQIWPIDMPVSVYDRVWTRTDTLDQEDIQSGEFEKLARRPARSQALFADTELQRSGSLRRGVVVGSAQDFSLESGLNFDISGNITEDIELVASLTDRSTPIQPDGTTQTLREFDQVYIRMQHELGMLQMGDVDMRLDESSFAVIDRRLQGVNLQTNLDRYGDYQGSAAVVRGEYHEMEFNGQGGVQGPYRLSGAENESFIIVLAGSERVYINGRRLVRGEENDYVIDYGLGEITFTSNQIITDHTRITVDFQYMTDAYTRTVVAAEAENDELLNGRLSLGASVIREADNVNLSSQLFLSDTEREVLRQAGDDPDKAVISGAEAVEFQRDADFLLYSRVDTVYRGEEYQIFEHIPGDTSGVYRVDFSRVGDGEGDYRRVGRAANGILYEWAGPGQGEYAPQRRIPSPTEQNMMALRSTYRATSHLNIYGEWAGSQFDQNRLSQIDNHNNNDMSILGGIALKSRQLSLGQVGFDLKGRYEGADFTYFDRVREVEFGRRWNLVERRNAGEKRIEGSGNWSPTGHTNIEVGGGMIEIGDFDGTRGDLHVRSSEQGLPELDYFLEYISSNDRFRDEDGRWWRQRGRLDYEWSIPLGTLQPELEFETEDRTQKPIHSDSLLSESMRFFEMAPGLYYQLSNELRIGSTINYRRDYGVLDGSLSRKSYGLTQRYHLHFQKDDLFQTENMLGLRLRRFEEDFRNDQLSDRKGVLIRSVTDYRPWDRFLDTQFLYDVNTERRSLLQEAFIEVGPEMGQYVWEDLNQDGVQQIDEFFPEQNQNEGTFIKQLIPSDELFPVISLRARWRTTLDFSRLIDSHDARYSDRLEFLSGIQWRSVVDVSEENRTENLEDIYLLQFNQFRDDSLTISGRWYVDQEITFFRNNTRRELRLSADRLLSQNQQSSGVEKQHVDNVIIRGGGRISRRYRASVKMSLGRNESLSESFTSRNYLISSRVFRPRLDIRWDQSWQSGVGFSLIRNTDRFPDEDAKVSGLRVFGDSRLHMSTRWQSTLRLEHRSYKRDGGQATSMGQFELTEGAGLGDTWAWSLQSDYRISDFLRASFQYEGRSVSGRTPVQTLRFTVNAVF